MGDARPGRFYTRTLRTLDSHAVVERGPYRRVRHPGYLGSLLLLGGAALARSNWVAAIIVATMMGIVYSYRIVAEEAMLIGEFGEEYRAYMSRSRRLIPFLY